MNIFNPSIPQSLNGCIMSIIEINHVTKEYRLGHMKSLKQSVANRIRAIAWQADTEARRDGTSPLTQESRADPFSQASSICFISNSCRINYPITGAIFGFFWFWNFG